MASEGSLKGHVKAFLAYLRLNRNASPHTVRAYESDLAQLLAFLAAARGRPVSSLEPSDFDTAGVRGFLGDLYERGNSRASAARKLAAVRSFARYLRREGDHRRAIRARWSARRGGSRRSRPTSRWTRWRSSSRCRT